MTRSEEMELQEFIVKIHRILTEWRVSEEPSISAIDAIDALFSEGMPDAVEKAIEADEHKGEV